MSIATYVYQMCIVSLRLEDSGKERTHRSVDCVRGPDLADERVGVKEHVKVPSGQKQDARPVHWFTPEQLNFFAKGEYVFVEHNH